jgi:hypothetical protein
MTIQNDKEFRSALDTLSIDQQRALGALFIQRVQHLCDNLMIDKAIAIAKDTEYDNVAMNEMFKGVRSLSTQTYTACGGDACWPEQAAHFVATAAKACLTPEDQMGIQSNLAWKTAIQTRLANNCEMIENDAGETNSEAQKQYALTEKFFSQRENEVGDKR